MPHLPASADADLFVCECSFYEIQVPQHLTWVGQLQPALARLSARRYLLTHLSEEMRAHAAEAERVERVRVADDGMHIEI